MGRVCDRWGGWGIIEGSGPELHSGLASWGVLIKGVNVAVDSLCLECGIVTQTDKWLI